MESITEMWFICVRPAITFGITASFGVLLCHWFSCRVLLMLSYLLDLGQVLLSHLLRRSFYVAYWLFRSICVVLFIIDVISVVLSAIQVNLILCFHACYSGQFMLSYLSLRSVYVFLYIILVGLCCIINLLSRSVYFVLSVIVVSLYCLIIFLVSLC